MESHCSAVGNAVPHKLRRHQEYSGIMNESEIKENNQLIKILSNMAERIRAPDSCSGVSGQQSVSLVPSILYHNCFVLRMGNKAIDLMYWDL